MANLLRDFQALLPASPLLVGDVVSIANGLVANVELPGGALISARGAARVGQRVFVRAGAIEGQAPALPFVEIVV